MKKILLFIVLWCCVFVSQEAHAQAWQWARGAMCTSGFGQGSEGFAVSAKSPNNIYFAGYSFADSICFGSYGFYFPTGTMGEQAIFGKYDSCGDINWAIAGEGRSYSIDLTSDAEGNLFYFGYFTSDSITFGTHTLINPTTPVGTPCYFVMKVDVYGNIIWITKGSKFNPGGNIGVKYGTVALDQQDNIYLASTFSDTAMHIGSYTLSDTGIAGSRDIFIAKYDSSGNLIWAKHLGGRGEDLVTCVNVSKENRIYLTGYFSSDSVKFGSTTISLSGPAPLTDYPCMFLTEMDTSGNVIWAKSPIGSMAAMSVSVGSDNSVYVSGQTIDSVVTIGVYTYNNINNEAFLIKYDTTGNVIWSKIIGPAIPPGFGAISGGTIIYGIAVDTSKNVWICGGMGKTNIFVDSITILDTLTGSVDPMFLISYDSHGNVLDTFALRSGGDDNSSISVDGMGSIYLCGDYEKSPFIVANDTLLLNDGVVESIFVAKYGINYSWGCGFVAAGIIGDSILCKGDSILLSDATTGGIWSSSNVSVAMVGSGSGMVTGLSLGTAVITYSVGSGYVTKMVTVSASPAPITGAGVGPDYLCFQSLPTTLSDATPGGVWSSSNPVVAAVGSLSGIVTPGAAGGDIIFYTISPGCYTSVPVIECDAAVPQISGANDQIELFPNPAKDQLTITSTGKISGIKITNLLGQAVYSQQSAIGSSQVQVDVSAFPPGVYFVKVNGPDSYREVRKFVKE